MLDVYSKLKFVVVWANYIEEGEGTARSGIARFGCMKLRALGRGFSIGKRCFSRPSTDGMGDQKCHHRENQEASFTIAERRRASSYWLPKCR
jgi:hypothetical protein